MSKACVPFEMPVMAVDEARRGGVDRASQLIYVCFPGCTIPTGPGPGPPPA